jgi:hypothetical protein
MAKRSKEWEQAADAHALALDHLAAVRTSFLQRMATPLALRTARRAVRQAAQRLIGATYADGREPSPYMVGALPRMYASATPKAVRA